MRRFLHMTPELVAKQPHHPDAPGSESSEGANCQEGTMVSKPTESVSAMDAVEDNSEPIHWGIERTKLLSDIRAADIPCGLSAYDIAIDFRPESS